MSLFRHVKRGLRALFNRKAADREIADEIAHYLRESEASFTAGGLPPDEALRLRTGQHLLVRLRGRVLVPLRGRVDCRDAAPAAGLGRPCSESCRGRHAAANTR